MFFTVSEFTTFVVVLALLGDTAQSTGKLERPQEVVGFLEVRTNRVDLVNQILDTKDIVFAKRLFNDAVIGKGNALGIHLAVSTLVDQFTDRFEVGVSIPLQKTKRTDTILKTSFCACVCKICLRDVWLHNTQHVDRGLVDLDEDTSVDLTKTKQLQDLLGLWCHTVDTTDTHDKHNLSLRSHIEVALILGLTTKIDLRSLQLTIFANILLGTLEDHLAGLGTGLTHTHTHR